MPGCKVLLSAGTVFQAADKASKRASAARSLTCDLVWEYLPAIVGEGNWISPTINLKLVEKSTGRQCLLQETVDQYRQVAEYIRHQTANVLSNAEQAQLKSDVEEEHCSTQEELRGKSNSHSSKRSENDASHHSHRADGGKPPSGGSLASLDSTPPMFQRRSSSPKQWRSSSPSPLPLPQRRACSPPCRQSSLSSLSPLRQGRYSSSTSR